MLGHKFKLFKTIEAMPSKNQIGFPEEMTTELFASYIKSKLSNPNIIDISHSNAVKYQGLEVTETAETILSTHQKTFLCGYHAETIPTTLRELGYKKIFSSMTGMEKISKDNIVIVPQTSTLLNKLALKCLRLRALEKFNKQNNLKSTFKPVALYPEGNFRYNHNNIGVSEVGMRIVPIDRTIYKITPETLEQALKESFLANEHPLSLILETPNNPWMQVYSQEEMRKLVEVTEKYNLFIINDLYLSGTESLELVQDPVISVANNKELIITTCGVRRIFGLDKFAKIGFLCTHNQDLCDDILQSVRCLHMKYTNADAIIINHFLSQYDYAKTLPIRQSLALARQQIEQQITEIDGLRILIPTQAGPFVTIGFTKEIEDKLDALDLKEGYKLATYIAEISNVITLPLCDMFTNHIGLRINAAYDETQTKTALNRLKLSIEAIKNNIPFSSIKKEADDMFINVKQEIYSAKSVIKI